MSELVLSLNEDIIAEGDNYFDLAEFLASARKGRLSYRVYPFRRTVLVASGRESERTFAKGERVSLVTRTASQFDEIFKGIGRLASSLTQISRIRLVAATPDSDDNPREFLVVVRNGEDLVYVEDVFPSAWGGLRTKNVFPRYYWIEVNRLLPLLPSSTVPSIPTEKTVSAYVEDEENDKLSDDVARELYLVEELGRCSDEITELQIEKMGWKAQAKKLKRENEQMRQELLRHEAEKAQLLKSTANEIKRVRTQQRTDRLQALVAADRSRSAASSTSSSSSSSAPSSSSSARLARCLSDGRGFGGGEDGEPPTKQASMRKVSPDK